MSKRRSYSSIDKLPAEIKDAVNRMIIDLQWPDDFPRNAAFGFKGKESELTGIPTYEDVEIYCKHKGHDISHSAVGRYGMRMKTLSRMKQAGVITRDIMKNTSDANASETQKAVSEMITAATIEFMSGTDDFTSKQLKEVAQAMRECTAIAINADKYIRQQIAERIKTVSKKVSDQIADKKIAKIVQDAFDELMLGAKK